MVPDIDMLSDGGFCEMGTYPGIALPPTSTNDPVLDGAEGGGGLSAGQLANTLRSLNPAEVERRRRLLSTNRWVMTNILS